MPPGVRLRSGTPHQHGERTRRPVRRPGTCPWGRPLRSPSGPMATGQWLRSLSVRDRVRSSYFRAITRTPGPAGVLGSKRPKTGSARRSPTGSGGRPGLYLSGSVGAKSSCARPWRQAAHRERTGHCPVAIGPEGDRSGQPQGQSRAVEPGAVFVHRAGVACPSSQSNAGRHSCLNGNWPRTTHRTPDELGRGLDVASDRHVVFDLGDAIRMREAGDRGMLVSSRVVLSGGLPRSQSGQSREPPLFRVEDRPEHAGRVEKRGQAETNRSTRPD